MWHTYRLYTETLFKYDFGLWFGVISLGLNKPLNISVQTQFTHTMNLFCVLTDHKQKFHDRFEEFIIGAFDQDINY